MVHYDYLRFFVDIDIKHESQELLMKTKYKIISILKLFSKPRFFMSDTIIFPHNSQHMTYFVTKFGMRKLVWCPNSRYNFRTIGRQLQILSYTAHYKNQQSFIIAAMGSLSPKFTIGEIG